MSSDGTPPEKKDLTGIMELPQLDPTQADGTPVEEDPFAVNELQPIEAIDAFESIDQIGMMDHEPSPEEQVDQVPPSEDPFQELSSLDQAPPEPTLDFSTESVMDALPPMDFLSESPVAEFPTSEPTLTEKKLDTLNELRAYSERAKEAAFEPGVRNPFHLMIAGNFDLYSRDKLLLFITENEIGINSSDLDFQITSGRVLFPRISEFSGIKLIQDLRDSGLSFKLKASDRDQDETIPEDTSIRFQYKEESRRSENQQKLPILPYSASINSEYQVIDSIQMVHYLRAEILEVEKSDLFQELLDRMTEALRRRAVLKGAHAITSLQHKITPLRLPSQYQLELTASLLKKHTSV